MANNNVEIKVEVDVQGAPQVRELGDGLNSTGRSAVTMGDKIGQSAAGVNQGAAAAEGYTATSKNLRDGLESVSAQLARAKTELLGLLGVQAGAQGFKEIADLADSYKNLQARIKLTTGEGSAFGTAMQGVFDVAKRTNSAVEETGLLFTKLAEAGRTLGLSQQSALALTETINQSIQLSGASAEASKAAIVQLVQGLQSGVLRGDEFNSIMEQSPRLAKALADGLGVTTGELRKLAEEGRLTSSAVIDALQKQSGAIAGEFKQLPATVGRAMQNLSTEFLRYIGEADQAHGYSAKLAAGIEALAGHLSSVATVMLHTGQALGAMKLLAMAQEWLGASSAIKATTAATEQASAATVANTAARVQNTATTVANTAAQTANARAWGDIAAHVGGVAPNLSAAGQAAAGAAPKVAAFGTALSAIKTFALVDVVLNLKQYGTAIGEYIAKLGGAKDANALLAAEEKRLAEVQAQNADMRRKQAADLKEATEASFGLSQAAAKLVADFDDMRAKGDSAAQAIKKIGAGFDLASVPGIKDAAGVLDKLVSSGKVSSAQFEAAWAEALKGQDLAKFEAMAKAAFAGAAREAEQTAQATDAALREALRRGGDAYKTLAQKSTDAATSAISDTDRMIAGLDRLKAKGEDAAAALTASIGKGIDTASTQKDLETIRTQIEKVRALLGDQVADGLLEQAKTRAEELKKKLEELTPGIQSAKEAMRLLGVTSDEELKKVAQSTKAAYDALKEGGSASTRELAEGFKKVAEAAIAANQGIAPAWVQAEAALRGYTLVTDEAGKATLRLAGANKEAEKGMQGQASATDSATGALERQIAAQEKANALLERAAELKRKYLNVDKEGFVLNTAGQKVVQQVDTRASVYQKAKSAGLDDAAALKIAGQFIGENGQILGQQNADTSAGENWYSVVQKAINDAVLGQAKAKAGGQQATGKSYQVNVNLNGQSTTINTSSDADAQALIELLERAKRAAGQ